MPCLFIYFDLTDDGQSFHDECGIELDDLSEARVQAQALLPNLAREKVPTKNQIDIAVIVRCDEGRQCYKAALTIQGEWVAPNGG